MKLLLLPIAIMLFLSVLVMTGITSDNSTLGQEQIYVTEYGEPIDIGNGTYYDSGGHAVCWENLSYSGIGEQGVVVRSTFDDYAYWRNATDWGTTHMWQIYSDTEGAVPILYADLPAHDAAGLITKNAYTFDMGTSLGLIAIVVVIMGVGAIAGIKILGSGESEMSVDLLIKGTFFLAIWGILSVLAYPLILESGFYMYIGYFAITLMYTIGIINSVGSPNND